MRQILRLFSKLPEIRSPLSSYMSKINTKDVILEMARLQRQDISKFKEQKNLLKDLELPSMFKLKEFPNEKLLTLLKAYSVYEQGSPRLYSLVIQQIFKRINSFSYEELATIVYFLSNVPQADKVFDAICDILMKDPLEIPVEAIGKLSFSFAVRNKNVHDLYKALTNIFCAAKSEVSAENGFLFLTGICKLKCANSALLQHIQHWIDIKWSDFKPTEISHMIFILFHLEMIDLAKIKVHSLDLDKLTATDIDKIIGCYLETASVIPQSLINQLLKLIQQLRVNSTELFALIYTLNQIETNEQHFGEIENLLSKTIHLISNNEKIQIFLAFLNTCRENEHILQLFSNEFHNSFSSEQLAMLIPAFVNRRNLFLPYTEKILSMITAQVQGKAVNLEELLVFMYGFIRLGYKDERFWRAALSAIISLKPSSAEEYIQIKKTVSAAKALEIDVSSCIEYLEATYERP